MKHIVIPARFASSRLPGKPLLEIHGRPMILRVVDQAKKVEGFDDLCVATDDVRIADVCRAEGVDVVLTSADHPSGTDRLSEVARIKGWASDDIIVNVQGDEPLLPAQLVKQVAQLLVDRCRHCANQFMHWTSSSVTALSKWSCLNTIRLCILAARPFLMIVTGRKMPCRNCMIRLIVIWACMPIG